MPNQTLESVLLLHAKRYPQSTAQDYIKLLYQREFGPGHLMSDPQSALARLLSEKQTAAPCLYPFDSLGNGLIRVHLHPLDDAGINALSDAFIRTASTHKGDTDRLKCDLKRLRKMVGMGELPITTAALEAFLSEYGYFKADFKPHAVHHSDAYRKAYHPAYRVVAESLIDTEIVEIRGTI